MRALSSYVDRLEWEKLQAEMEAFQAQLPALLVAYPDQYVAMHEDQVIDHDADLRTLHSRVYAQMGSVPVLLQKVAATPAPDILVRSPRVEGRYLTVLRARIDAVLRRAEQSRRLRAGPPAMPSTP